MGAHVTENSPGIDGLTVVALRQIEDERGAVLHVLRADATDFSGFGECYISEIVPGAVKAWKWHRDQTQNIAVPFGRIRLVVFDDREDSPTRGCVANLELGRPDAYSRVRLPPQLWYGFGCISDTCALLVNCSNMPHDPAESATRPLGDPSIPYTWQ